VAGIAGYGRIGDPSPMSTRAGNAAATDVPARQRWREYLVFLLLAVVIWPFIAVGVVAGWGFIVWMYYLLTGPPGPH
jgi:nitrate reductase NapE